VLARGVGGSPFANRDLAMRPVTNQGQILLPLTADDGCVESALTGPYPTLRVVGLEPADPPRREAIAKIETADYSDRIEIRDQPVEALTDVEGFDLVYLPQVFLSEDAPSISTPPVLQDSTRQPLAVSAWTSAAFAPLTGRIRTALPYLSGPGVQTVIERSGIPRAEADQSRSSSVYDNPGGSSS
jgi:hypothetical protein